MQYKNLVDQGKLQHDPYQESVATELQNLLARLENYEREMEEYHVNFVIGFLHLFVAFWIVFELVFVCFVIG